MLEKKKKKKKTHYSLDENWIRFPRRVSVKQFLKARQVGGAQTKRKLTSVGQRGVHFSPVLVRVTKRADFSRRLTI